MKKVLSVFLCLLLLVSMVACGNKIEITEGAYVYESLGDSNMKNMLTNYPTSIEIMSDELGCGYMVEDSNEILEIVDAFSLLTIGGECEPGDFIMTDATFNFGSKAYTMSFYGDCMLVASKDSEVFYKVNNFEQYKEVINRLISIRFELNKEYRTILTSGPVELSLASVMEDAAGNVEFDIATNNTSPTETYAFRIEAEVNGYKLNTYQTLFLMPESDTGYTCAIPTVALHELGIETIDEVRYKVLLFKGDSETLETTEFVAESEEFVETFGPVGTYTVTGTTIYEENGYKVVYKMGEDDYGYTSLYFYFENANENEVMFKINEFKYNGEIMDLSDYPEITDVYVKNGTFLMLPLYNYEWNEETMEATIIPIESASLVLALQNESGTVEIPELILK